MYVTLLASRKSASFHRKCKKKTIPTDDDQYERILITMMMMMMIQDICKKKKEKIVWNTLICCYFCYPREREDCLNQNTTKSARLPEEMKCRKKKKEERVLGGKHRFRINWQFVWSTRGGREGAKKVYSKHNENWEVKTNKHGFLDWYEPVEGEREGGNEEGWCSNGEGNIQNRNNLYLDNKSEMNAKKGCIWKVQVNRTRRKWKRRGGETTV